MISENRKNTISVDHIFPATHSPLRICVLLIRTNACSRCFVVVVYCTSLISLCCMPSDSVLCIIHHMTCHVSLLPLMSLT